MGRNNNNKSGVIAAASSIVKNINQQPIKGAAVQPQKQIVPANQNNGGGATSRIENALNIWMDYYTPPTFTYISQIKSAKQAVAPAAAPAKVKLKIYFQFFPCAPNQLL